MNINLKLKERRDKINKQISRDKTKTIRKYQQELKTIEDDGDQAIKRKIDLFMENEKKQNEYEQKFSGIEWKESNDKESKERKSDRKDQKNDNDASFPTKKEHYDKKKKDKTYLNEKHDKNEHQFLNKKRAQEDIDKEKEAKLNKRKKNYRNLSKRTKYGQPIMKYRIQNILSQIKSKKNKGII